MADTNSYSSDASAGSQRSELMPAAMLPGKANVNAVMLQPGLSRLAPAAEGLDPKLLIKALRRRWKLALSLGFVLALVVGITAVLMPAKYTSKSQLHVRTFAPKVIFETREQGSDFQTFKQTQIQMIKSRAVLGPALRDPKVVNLATIKNEVDPAEWLEKNIVVSFPAGSELLTIEMTNDNPDVLEPIVNAVVKAYLETVVEEDHQTRIQRLERLKKLYDKYQEELRTKRQSLRMLSNTVGTEDRSTLILSQQFKMESLQTVQREQMSIQANLRQLNAAKAYIEKAEKPAANTPATPAPSANVATKAAADPTVVDAMIESRIATDPTILGIQKEIDVYQTKLDKLRKLSRNQVDPAVNSARAKLQGYKEDLKEHRARLRDVLLSSANRVEGGVREPLNGPAQAGSVSNIERLNDNIAIYKAREAELAKEIEKHRSDVTKLNGTTIDLQTEQEDIALITETARKIGQEVEALDVELQAPRRISVWTPADSPRRKDIAKQYIMCVGAAFGVFALTMLGVSFWEMRAMRIGSVDEVVRNLGLPLVGTLPVIPTRSSKLSKADDQRWQGLLVESIDATRTMLLHASRVNNTRAVLIASAMKGEGKTSLAAHLATSLARSGRKTLLVDCDLRRPRLHQLFDMPRVPGLCELLRGEAEINDVIRPTPADDLNLIPAGTCDGLALQAIAQENFREILQVLKKRYDFIIIDSAPILPVVDTMLLSQQVDGVLFSIMRDVSRIPHVRAAYERLESLGVKMLGAVVSAAERRDYMHMYDYEYQSVESE